MIAGSNLVPKINQMKASSKDYVVEGYFVSNVKFALDIISKKWVIDILMVLTGDSLRFTEVQRYVKGISDKVLTERLAEMQTFDLVKKEVIELTPLTVRYTCSPTGLRILRALSAMSSIGSDLRERID